MPYTARARSVWLGAGAALALLYVLVASAWVCDDAYITFRTLDNLARGLGLTWNPPDRVQTYSHPLWLLALAVPHALTREVYLTSLALSLALSLAAVLVLLARVARPGWTAAWALVALIGSKAFVDFSTSGLENPLTHLLAVLFVGVLAAQPPPLPPRRLFAVVLLAALAAVNRLDTLPLFAPAAAWAVARSRSPRALAAAAAGLSPLVAWTLFALLYYGFALPNTAYAKLATGLSAGEYARQGLRYLAACLRHDPLTPAVIVTFLCAVAAVWRRRASERWALWCGLGVLLQLVWVVRAGGDFMTGRFLTLPFVVAVAALSRLFPAWHGRRAVAALLLTFAVGLAGKAPPLFCGAGFGRDGGRDGPLPWWNSRDDERHGVVDERAHYYQDCGLLPLLARGARAPLHPWAEQGRLSRDSDAGPFVRGPVGLFGYYAGPRQRVVDLCGLGDPLLARLPMRADLRRPVPTWRIGHFFRHLPLGYYQTVRDGRNALADPGLAQAWDRLGLLARGPLLARGRLAEIWRFNTGRRDGLFAGDHAVDATVYPEAGDPVSLAAYELRRARLLLGRGHVVEGLALARRAAALDPGATAPCELLARHHLAVGEPAAAREWARELEARGGTLDPALRAALHGAPR